jgi:hypothetical protein
MVAHPAQTNPGADATFARVLSTTFVAVAVGIFALAAASGLIGSVAVGAGIAVAAAVVTAGLWWKHPPVAFGVTALPASFKALAVVATVVALVQMTRLAVYTVDPSQVGCSVVPSSDWEVHHSCVSAYYVAARAGAANVYDESLYTLPGGDPTAPRQARLLGPFRIDVYEYPPPFLLVPRALTLVAGDFQSFRMLWFALNGAVVLLASIFVARSLPPAMAARAVLLVPLVWASISTMSTMQKGNVQLAVIAVSISAMLLFERRRHAAGGALLAYATVSKLYPGMLVLYLLSRRQWRAAAWTAAFSAGLVAVSLLDTGWSPYAAFLQHLPRLLGGEAFPAFRNPGSVAINYSIPGLIFKLKLFGLAGMDFGSAKIVGWIYTAITVAMTIVIARRPLADEQKPLAWLAVIFFATLRSPFLPQTYATFPSLWMLTLLTAALAPTWRTVAVTSLLWMILNVYLVVDWRLDARVKAAIALLPHALTVVLAGIAIARLRSAPSALPDASRTA